MEGGAASGRRHQYLEGKSVFLGNLAFETEVPLPPAAPKLLPFPAWLEVFAAYRPTPLESFKSNVFTESDGINVDQLDPKCYESDASRVPTLHPQDARLLVGVVPNVESFMAAQRAKASGGEEEIANTKRIATPRQKSPRKAENRQEIDLVERIEKSFAIPDESFQHSTKKHLKPVKITPLLPNIDLWSNRYAQIALEGADQLSYDLHAKNAAATNAKLFRPYLLQHIGAGNTLKRYALHGGPRGSEGEQGLSGLYHHVRDYIVEVRQKPTSVERNFLLSLPGPAASRDEVARILPLCGAKKIYQKASAKLGVDSRRHKVPLQLEMREPTTEEAAASVDAISIFQQIARSPDVSETEEVGSRLEKTKVFGSSDEENEKTTTRRRRRSQSASSSSSESCSGTDSRRSSESGSGSTSGSSGSRSSFESEASDSER